MEEVSRLKTLIPQIFGFIHKSIIKELIYQIHNTSFKALIAIST